jgi:hypothetical protein
MQSSSPHRRRREPSAYRRTFYTGYRQWSLGNTNVADTDAFGYFIGRTTIR